MPGKLVEGKQLWTTEEVQTQQIKVGDILCIQDDTTVPADCVLLSTDPTRPGNLGQCFISTGNLDGERNLKPKMSIVNAERNFHEIVEGTTLIEINCPDHPNPDLYNFQNAEMKIVKDK